MSTTITIATYNLRFTLDRWRERKESMYNTIKTVDADIYGFQELCIGGVVLGQDIEMKRLFSTTNRRTISFERDAAFLWCILSPFFGAYLSRLLTRLMSLFLDVCALMSLLTEPLFGHWVEPIFYSPLLSPLLLLVGAPWTFGNGILVRAKGKGDEGDIISMGKGQADTLCIGSWRTAQRSLVHVKVGPEGRILPLWIVNTHLASEENNTLRTRQAQKILDWMEPIVQSSPDVLVVFVGDFNSRPTEPAYQTVLDAGYTSSYKEIHGEEPKYTFPSGLKGPATHDLDSPKVLDYIFYKTSGTTRFKVQAVASKVFGDVPSNDHDKTLYPSDHCGISTTYRIETI